MAGFAQFLFTSWRAAQLGFWQGGSVAAGETKRAGNFETSNPLIECQKSTQKVARVSVVLPSYFRIIVNQLKIHFFDRKLQKLYLFFVLNHMCVEKVYVPIEST